MHYALLLLLFFAAGCAADAPAPEPASDPPLEGVYGPGGKPSDAEVETDPKALVPPSAPGLDDPETGLVDVEDDTEDL